jgi:histidinol-phosphate phosphatase family protein
MALSAGARRAVDARVAARAAALKAACAEQIRRIQAAVDPPLSNAELSLGLELPRSSIGRYLSERPRSRAVVPDRFVRAILDRLLTGDALLCVVDGDDGVRRVDVCERAEAQRLRAPWLVYDVGAGRRVGEDRDDWEAADAWDLFGTGEEAARVSPGSAGGDAEPVAPARWPLWPDGPVVPAVGLGAMRLSTAGRPARRDAIAVVHAALDAGARLIDTADVYAIDEADLHHNEGLIAEALRTWEGDTATVVVATKGGLGRRGPRWFPSGRPEHLLEAAARSREALGVERLALWQLHAVDTRVPLDETADAMRRLLDDGIASRVGVCNASLDALDTLVAQVPLVSVQNKINPLEGAAFDPRDGRPTILERAAELRLAVLAHSPVGGHRAAARLLRAPGFREVASARGVSVQSVCLAWLRSMGPHVFPIPGATRPESIRDSLASLRIELTDAERASLDARRAGAEATRGAVAARLRPPREVVIVMGSPASGKTSRVAQYLARGYHRLNRDEMGGRLDDLLPHLERAADDGQTAFVLDNTYPTRRSRAGLIRAATKRELPVRCLWIDASLDDCRFNAARRMVGRHGRILEPDEIKAAARAEANTFGPEVLTAWRRSFESPETAEGFAAVERIPYVRDLGAGYDRKALILDYDRTLRRTRGGVYPTAPEQVEILDGRVPVLQRYVDAGYILLGVTNQSGVADGRIDLETARACVDRTNELLGFDIRTEICPHPARGARCWCRKPMPGLGVLLIERHRLDPTACIYVGDRDSDAGFAAACGFRFEHADDFFA